MPRGVTRRGRRCRRSASPAGKGLRARSRESCQPCGTRDFRDPSQPTCGWVRGECVVRGEHGECGRGSRLGCVEGCMIFGRDLCGGRVKVCREVEEGGVDDELTIS